jgi:exopolysaccharide production protein ExoY
MLIQWPSGSNQPGPQNAEGNADFESALRRDLASAPIVSYDAVLGGRQKRLADFLLALVCAPPWAVVTLAVAAWLKLSGKRPVIVREERIGYGGRAFRCMRFNVASARDVGASDAQTQSAQFIERLPQLVHVLTGEMALAGPTPLSHAELEPLKSARRYYLSARPGIVGLGGLMEHGREEPAAYKRYAMSWSLGTDVLILWDALGGRARPAQETL